MRQRSFADFEYGMKKKVTRREKFLGEIDCLVPWSNLLLELEPYYPQGDRGRPPMGLEKMLRMLIAQQCFGLSDEGIEEAIYDSQSIRSFVRLDLGREEVPDATTLLKFRRLLESHGLLSGIFTLINAQLAAHGLLLREGTIVDATLISAPSSTKNREGKRDEEMHSVKKGDNWHFGMKAHIGVDADSGLVHTLIGTPANTSDVTQAHALLHGEEQNGFGDSGYRGIEKREENSGKEIAWHIAMMPGKRKVLDKTTESGRLLERIEKIKACIRAKVEHPFHIIKNIFKHRKVRYKGLLKNTGQLYLLFGLANLLIARKWLLAINSQVVS